MLSLQDGSRRQGAGMCARQELNTRSTGSFWRCLSGAERDAFTAIGQARRFHKGETLMVRSRPVRWAGILQRGHVRLVAYDQVLETRSAGDIVGEGAVINDFPRTPAVIAASEVRVLVLGRVELERLVTQNPRVLRVLCAVLGQRLHRAYYSLLDHADKPFTKVVRELLRRAEECGHDGARRVIIEIGSQAVLGESLGISRDSVVRALQRLRGEDVLSTYRRLVTVHDISSLRAHAGR